MHLHTYMLYLFNIKCEHFKDKVDKITLFVVRTSNFHINTTLSHGARQSHDKQATPTSLEYPLVEMMKAPG